jgi:hypothetical protein
LTCPPTILNIDPVMKTAYKKPSKIRISKDRKVDILDLLDVTLGDISSDNYTNLKVGAYHPHADNMLDLNDLYREIQGADYMIEVLQKLKAERVKETDKLLKKISKK